MIAWVDGELLEESRARVSIHDRGFLFGDALYETFLVHRGGVFRLTRHVERLREGAARLRMPAPSATEVQAVLARLVEANGISDGVARLTLTRGTGGTGLSPRGVRGSTVVATLRPVDPEWKARAREGWTLATAGTRTAVLAEGEAALKSVDKLDAILARIEAEERGADDALLLTHDGRVAEGTVCNVFWRTGRRLFTPALSVGILPGVTREAFLEVAAERSVRVTEGAFPRAALDDAEEIFLTMTSVGGVPVRALDDRPLPGGPEDLLPELDRAYWACVASEAESL